MIRELLRKLPWRLRRSIRHSTLGEVLHIERWVP
jgi:hypothetical protein